MPDIENCPRKAPRKNMFVMAAMSSASFTGPIKIRNLSSSGALVEGHHLPPVGSSITLRRGEITAAGQIVWRNEGKAGLHMHDFVNVSEWMPGGNAHQNSVDLLIENVKREQRLNVIAQPTERNHTFCADDLISLADAICELADELSKHERVVSLVGVKLQTLDIASQFLRKVATGTIRANVSDSDTRVIS